MKSKVSKTPDAPSSSELIRRQFLNLLSGSYKWTGNYNEPLQNPENDNMRCVVSQESLFKWMNTTDIKTSQSCDHWWWLWIVCIAKSTFREWRISGNLSTLHVCNLTLSAVGVWSCRPRRKSLSATHVTLSLQTTMQDVLEHFITYSLYFSR